MSQGILYVLLLLGSSAPLASCVGTLMRKEAKEANDAESYVLASSGAIVESRTMGGTSNIDKGFALLEAEDNPLSSWPGNIEAPPVERIIPDSCRSHLTDAEACGKDEQSESCASWNAIGDDTKLAYGAALLAGKASLSTQLSKDLFPLRPTDSNDQQPAAGGVCAPGPKPCFDLETADPLEWCCNCVAKMMEKCQGVHEECFRHIMCEHEQVSKGWKEKNKCDQTSIETGCDLDEEEKEGEDIPITKASLAKGAPSAAGGPEDSKHRVRAGGFGQQDQLMERQHSVATAAKAQESSLDESLEDKCNSGCR